jgi:hypothetical protein
MDLSNRTAPVTKVQPLLKQLLHQCHLQQSPQGIDLGPNGSTMLSLHFTSSSSSSSGGSTRQPASSHP